MIIYEVNLTISMAIADAYFEWLHPHVAEMLTFSGFTKATIFKELRTHDPDTINLSVQYFIESLRDLDDYLENNSQRMREESFNKFPGGFSITRRIFKVIE